MVFGFGGSKKKEALTDEEKAEKDKAAAEKKDGDDKKSAEPTRADKLKEEAKNRAIDFFGNQPGPTKEEKEKAQAEKEKRNSWRNLTVTIFSFVVFVFAFVLQIWIIARTVEASKTDAKTVPPNGRGEYTSSFPIGTFTRTSMVLTTDINGDYTSVLTRVTITNTVTSATTRSTGRRTTGTDTATATVYEDRPDRPTPAPVSSRARSGGGDAEKERTRSTSTIPASASRKEEPAHDDEVPWLHKRALGGSRGPTNNVTAQCLYYNGSELPKQGGFAVALNVIYNIWIMVRESSPRMQRHILRHLADLHHHSSLLRAEAAKAEPESA